MFGISYSKFDSMTYVIQYKNGRIVREGRGLSFLYATLNSSIVAIPIGSNDLPFIFNDTTNDYQSLSIQGQITYKISDPKQLAELLDFTVNAAGVYKKNDIEKL
ncbi:MAG TPA: SPFH domain-containing protein, partial [Hymenobacter sp.]|nr:SPFH domain-containing protein [Hymenobacter sp.]